MSTLETGYLPETGDLVRVTRYVRVHATGERQDVTVHAGVITDAVPFQDGWYITLDTCPDRIFTGYQFCGPGTPDNGGAATFVTEVELLTGGAEDVTRFRQQLSPDLAVELDSSDCIVLRVTNPATGAVERTITVTDVDEHKDALDAARRAQRKVTRLAEQHRLDGLRGQDRARQMHTRLGRPLNRAVAANVLTGLGMQRGHAEAAVDRAQRYAGRLEPERVHTVYAGLIRVAYEDGSWLLTEAGNG